MGFLKLSRRPLAQLALRFARKRAIKFLEAVKADPAHYLGRANERIDLPLLDEAQEAVLFARLLDVALPMLEGVLRGTIAPGDVAFSKRALVRAAVVYAGENVDDLLAEGVDLPGIPERIEILTGQYLSALLLDVVAPWTEQTPLLD